MNEDRAGWHFIYDAHVDSGMADHLRDPEYLRNFLLEISEHLGMKVVMGPYVSEVPTNPNKLETQEDEGGVTGFVAIVSGHIAIHTWPLRERFSLDIYSCREYQSKEIEKLIRNRFPIRSRWVQDIHRIWPLGRFKTEKREKNPPKGYDKESDGTEPFQNHSRVEQAELQISQLHGTPVLGDDGLVTLQDVVQARCSGPDDRGIADDQPDPHQAD